MGEEEVELELPWKATMDDEGFVNPGYTTQTTSDAGVLHLSQNQKQVPTQRLRQRATSTPRFKRRNFSKRLQLLCLQGYAEYASKYGRIPNKHETEQILQQSYLQFLKDGGERDQSRLTHLEFLKLVRNRRSEIHARAQRSKDTQKTLKQTMVLTPAKRKLQEERDKIREFIEMIDRTREQAGQILDPQQVNQRRGLQASATTEVGKSGSISPVPLDPMEQMEAILRIQQETQKVQCEIAVRLRSLCRVIREHESHEDFEEPSSASV